MVCFHLLEILNMQTMVTGSRSVVSCKEEGEGGITKELRGPLGNDENAHFLDCGDGFTGIHMSKLIRLYT